MEIPFAARIQVSDEGYLKLRVPQNQPPIEPIQKLEKTLGLLKTEQEIEQIRRDIHRDNESGNGPLSIASQAMKIREYWSNMTRVLAEGTNFLRRKKGDICNEGYVWIHKDRLHWKQRNESNKELSVAMANLYGGNA